MPKTTLSDEQCKEFYKKYGAGQYVFLSGEVRVYVLVPNPSVGVCADGENFESAVNKAYIKFCKARLT